MKPKLLKIKGLNSFLEEQTIDFGKLITYGFFGIFGPTGSGKSTIIDAITLALYGKISRYDGEKKGMQCINTNTNIMSVYFEFQIQTESGYVDYIIERSFKQKESKMMPVVVRFYIKKDEDIEMLADQTNKATDEIKKVIGLSYEDFSRTVVLPQGKFSEFLMLANKDRRNMLERIFKLEKYGEFLAKKIRSKYTEEQNNFKMVSSNLDIYGDISEEEINKNNLKIEQEEEQFKKIKSELEQINLVLKNLKSTQEINNEYKIYILEKNNLLAYEKEIEEKKIMLNKGKKANIIIPFIENLESTDIKLTKNKEILKNESLNYENILEEEKKYDMKYKEAIKYKDENLPILQEKRFKTNEAITLSKELKVIETEREKLLKEYKIENSNFAKYENEKLVENKNKEVIKDELDQILMRKQEISIKPEFRTSIRTGYEYCLKDNEINEMVLTINDKYVKLKEKTEKNNLLLEQSQQQLFVIEKSLNENNQKLNEIALNMPDQNNLLVLKESIINKENLYKTNQELNVKIKQTEEKLNTLNKEIEEENINYNKINEQIIADDEEFSKIEISIENINKENLVSILLKDLVEGEPCPVCGSLKHEKHLNIENNDLKNLIKIKEELKKTIAKNKDQFQKTKISLELKIRDKEVSYQTKSEYVEKINVDIDVLKEEIIILKSDFVKLSSDLESFVTTNKKITDKITEEKNLSGELKIKIATLLEGINRDELSLKESEKDIKNLNEELNQVKNKIETLLKDMNIFEKERNYFFDWEQKIIQFDKENEKLDKREKQLRINIDIFEKTINEISEKMSNSEKEKQRITTSGKEKKEIIDVYVNKINILVGDINPMEYLEKLDVEIKVIIEREKITKEKLELVSKEKEKLQQLVENLKTQIGSLSEIKEEQKHILELKLNEENFDIQDVLKYKLEIEKQQVLEKNIDEYILKLNKVNNNIETVEQKLLGKNIENIDTQVDETQKQTEYLSELIEQKTKEIAVLKEITTKMKNDLEKTKILIIQKQKHSHQIDLLTDLSSLFQGNRFVEFVAKKQLKYITIEASNRLKEMTKGRYSLELDETDFVIRDDFNGGIRRTPRSLSGGETFMASLCLALALSSKIQLNNKNPLEFFFLDEGFGTLDINSLDDVINTLEKLRMEKINIGLISHSEELRNRVPIKLIVKKSENGLGTEVFVEKT